MASSLQEYLKRYASEEEKPKKRRKKKKDNVLKGKGALTIVDADPVWQKEIKEVSSESEAEQGEAPLVIEDVEFKRMQRLEALRLRPYIGTAADGSGWVSINETVIQGSSERSSAQHDGVESRLENREIEIRKSRHDTPPDGDLQDYAQHYNEDLSPQRRERNSEKRHYDMLTLDRDSSPSRHLASASKGCYDSPQSSPRRTGKNLDLSPPRRSQTSLVTRHHDSPTSSPPRTGKLVDLSPPRRRQTSLRSGRHDSPESSPLRTRKNVDLSPPRQRQTSLKLARHDSLESSPPRTGKNVDLSPPRRRQTSLKLGHQDSPESSPPRTGKNVDLSPPRRRQISLKSGRHDSPEAGSPTTGKNSDFSPPRRRQDSSRKGRHDSSESSPSRAGNNVDLSPPRRRLTSARIGHHDSSESSPPRRGKSLVVSPPRKSEMPTRMVEHNEDDMDLLLKRRLNHDDLESGGLHKLKRKEMMADGTAAGLQSGRQLAKETEKKKQDDSTRLKEVDVSISGRHANTVYRDKHGKRLKGVDEILKLQQAEEPKKEEKPLEWGRGLVQKREAEARYAELEAEKKKPFARSRDDPDLEKALKERIRWGDPMAHLVKKKADEPVLVDLGADESMKESGFIVPQAIPKHSWLKRGVTAPPNRYGIKPGRHWDGVDRSTGYERDMYKRQNEKDAERVEAYLWSVADM